MRPWPARLTAAVTVAGLLCSSCASLSVNSVAVPGTGHSDGYDIVAEFANVLNLPDRAKVIMDGTTVGVVTKVQIVGERVDVTSQIDRGVVVPSNTHAVLQQATVLGDIYLALERSDTQSAPPLPPGGRISMAHTTSPPQLEDTIANLANFIGSGSIQRAQSTLIHINKVTPPRDEARKIASRVATDLSDLSNNIDTVDTALNSLNETAKVLSNRTSALKFWFSPEGVGGFKRGVVLADTMSKLLPSVGTIYDGGYWIVPMIDSLGAALGAIQHTKWSVEEEYYAYRRFITEYFLPQDRYPAINITSIIGPDGRELIGNVDQILRMLGAKP